MWAVSSSVNAVADAAAGGSASSQTRASNGHSAIQIPQYMHSDQSIVKLSRTCCVRCRGPGGEPGTGSVWLPMSMHHVGHSRAQIMQDVHAFSTNRIRACVIGLRPAPAVHPHL